MEAAITALEQQFTSAEQDLTYVSKKLEVEFATQNEDEHLNPVRLMERIKRVSEELPKLKEDVFKVLVAKQELIDVCQQGLFTNRAELHSFHRRAGASADGEGDLAAHSDDVAVRFGEMCNTWSEQAGDYLMQKPTAGAEYETQGPVSLTSSDLNAELVRTGMADGAAEETPAAADENEQPANAEQAGESGKREAKKDEAVDTSARCMATYIPVQIEEFSGLSSLVRGRSKLDDVNKVYDIIFKHFNNTELDAKERKKPLTIKQLTKLGAKVSGQTGESRLSTLRSLKIITMSKSGVAMVA